MTRSTEQEPSDNDPYPPDVGQYIQSPRRDDIPRQVTILENDQDDGAPWILHEVASELELFIGLSEDQKAQAHDSIHNAIHETTDVDRTMFR